MQYCPKCRIRVEKIDGCNHMTCYLCNYEWCWLCRGTYDELHFAPFNPLGCPGGGYVRPDSFWRNVLRKVGGLIFLLLLIPLFLLFFTSAMVLALLGNNNRLMRWFRPLHMCFRVWLVLLVLAVTMPLNVFVAPLTLIVGIPVFIGVKIYLYVQMNRRASRNIDRLMLEL